MLPKVSSTAEIMEAAKNSQLYANLISQLKKDFVLANLTLDLPSKIPPADLIKTILNKIDFLIKEDMAKLLNLLYIVDVSENTFKKNINDNSFVSSEKLCFLILKRTWQKVWFKDHYR
ncbi:hypothetical protein [Eudoraea sp.]|uniref:hypothetical protein n=1 Tax=Eudoraea sp. TaxID=1979955 RepID=UPI003C7255B0